MKQYTAKSIQCPTDPFPSPLFYLTLSNSLNWQTHSTLSSPSCQQQTHALCGRIAQAVSAQDNIRTPNKDRNSLLHMNQYFRSFFLKIHKKWESLYNSKHVYLLVCIVFSSCSTLFAMSTSLPRESRRQQPTLSISSYSVVQSTFTYKQKLSVKLKRLLVYCTTFLQSSI